MTDARAPEAGWYPDPTGSVGERWWTGMSWSEHMRVPAPPEGAASPVAASAVPTAVDVEEDEGDPDYLPLRRGGLGTAVAGKGRLRNVLAYRSLNLGAGAAILFVVTVVLADLAWHVSPFGVLGWIAVGLCLIGTGIAVLAILLAAVAFFRVPTYRGLGPALTGFVFGIVFAFTIPLAAAALQLVLATFG